MKTSPSLKASFFAAFFLCASLAHAQTTWDGGGGSDTSWGTAANWNADTLPSFNGTDSLTLISGFGSNTSLTLGADRSIGRLTFGGNATAISLSGNTLRLNSTNTTAASGTALWNANTADNVAASVNSSILLQSGVAGNYTGYFRENNNSSGGTIFNGAFTQGAGENWTLRFSRSAARGVFVLANASNSISALRNDGADLYADAIGAFSNAAITLSGGWTGTRTADHYTTPVSNSLTVNATSSWVSQINTRLTGSLSQGSSSLSYGSSTTSSNILTRLEYASMTGTGTIALVGGSVSVSSMGQFSTGTLNLGSSSSSVGVLVLSGASGNDVPTWSDFSSARTFNQSGGANTWRIDAGTAGANTALFGGFAARGADLVIPASGGNLSNSTFARNFALGSMSTLNGQRYANNAVKIETDIAYGTVNGNRYFNIAGNENTSKSTTGIVLAGPVHELAGQITGNNVIIYPIGQSNTQLGIVRISNPNNSLTGTSRWILGGNRAAFTTIGGGNITTPGNMGDLSTIVAIFTSDGAFGGATEVNVSSQSSSSQPTTGAVLFEDLVGATTFSRNINLQNISQSTGAAAWGSYAGNVTYTGTATLGGNLTGANNQILHVQSGTLSLGVAGSSAATIVNNMAGNTTFNKGGNGTLVLNDVTWSGSQGNNSWSIRGGSIRETGSTNATSLLGSNIAFAGGVLETNNTNQSGGFTRGLGTSSSTVRWTGGGGFSAVGGPLTVNIGGSGAGYTWASTGNFLVSGSPLIFGSQSSDNVVTFQNAVNFNNAQREIQVLDNSNSTDDYTAITGNLTGTGSSGINKTGNGTLVLGNTNAYTGVTTISAGTLRISSIGNGGAVSSLGNSTNAASNLVFSGGTLEYAGASNGSTDRNFTLTAGTGGTIAVTGAGELTISGTSSSTNGTFTKSGSGTLILNGNNLHTGTTTLATGTLQAGNSGALGDGGDLIFASGTLRYTAASSGTDYASRIKNSSAAISLDTNGNNVTLDALAVTNTGGLSKSGSGMLTLSGVNSYTGSTIISAGTLNVAGSVAGTTLVNSGATLAGSGTLGGATTLNSGAILSPGNGPGILSFGSSLALNDGSDIRMEINGSTRGTSYDAINVTGALTYDGNLQLTFGQSFGIGNHTFNLWSFGSQFGSFDSITLAGSYIGSLLNNSGIWSGGSGLDAFEFSQSTGSLSLTVAVPEPGTWALLAIASSFLLWRRRLSS
jgi:autotransporter-associated beta strand protein